MEQSSRDPAMEALVSASDSKSEKMRKLAAAGYSRRQIADFLGVRYQFVRNVLVDEQRKAQVRVTEMADRGGMAEPKRSFVAEPSSAKQLPPPYGGVAVLADGSAVVPAHIMAEAGYRPGDYFVPDVAGKGDVRLLTGEAAMRRAQELIRQHIPENVSLVDELLKERRREFEKFERELKDGYG